jgi:phage tail protein X
MGSIAKWLANMQEFEALQPVTVVGAHGRMGDAGLIRRYREYLAAVQSRVAAAKRGGATVEQTTAMLAESLAMQFPDLAPPNGPATGRVTAAIQAAYREAP